MSFPVMRGMTIESLKVGINNTGQFEAESR